MPDIRAMAAKILLRGSNRAINPVEYLFSISINKIYLNPVIFGYGFVPDSIPCFIFFPEPNPDSPRGIICLLCCNCSVSSCIPWGKPD